MMNFKQEIYSSPFVPFVSQGNSCARFENSVFSSFQEYFCRMQYPKHLFCNCNYLQLNHTLNRDALFS